MWEINLKNQIFTFLLSLVLGMIVCLVYDLSCFAVRHKSKPFKTASDIVYFVFLAFVNFCFFLIASNGEMRLYLLVGELIGFIFCKKTLSVVFGLLLITLDKLIKSIKSILNRFVFGPAYNFLEKSAKITLKTGKKSLKIIKKGLKKHKDIVYTKEKYPNNGKRKEIANEL